MGEELKKVGVSRLVGVDIIPDAEQALYRDRPGIYDAYHTVDITDLDDDPRADLLSWRFNTLTVVAAAFNIKETFLDRSDTTGSPPRCAS